MHWNQPWKPTESVSFRALRSWSDLPMKMRPEPLENSSYARSRFSGRGQSVGPTFGQT